MIAAARWSSLLEFTCHAGVTSALFGMARTKRLMGKLDESEALFQKTLAACRECESTPDNIGLILSEYARLQWAKGNLPKADQLFTQAHQHTVAKRGANHRDVADILSSHSRLLKIRKKGEQSSQLQAKADQIYKNYH